MNTLNVLKQSPAGKYNIKDPEKVKTIIGWQLIETTQ